jgi:uncharacterized membrane protein YdjX (TVP38/TMEM64 family)
MARQVSIIRPIVISILFVALLVAVLVYFDAHEDVQRLLEWLDAQGIWGPGLFMLLMMIVVVFLLPGVMFTTGAGFVFGVVEGTVYVVIGTTLGAMLSFLVARHLLGERASRFVLRHAKLQLVTEELTSRGWKIVLLTRLVPFFPFKLSNYFFGMTRFTLRDFAAGTFVGIIPFSLHNAYLGSIAADISLAGARSADRSALEWGLYGTGFLVTVGFIICLNRLARQALAGYTEEGGEG